MRNSFALSLSALVFCLATITTLAYAGVPFKSIETGDVYYIIDSALSDKQLVTVVGADLSSQRIKVRYENGAVDWVFSSSLYTQSGAERKENKDAAEFFCALMSCKGDGISEKDWQPGMVKKDDPSLVTGEGYGSWRPAPGYEWVDPSSPGTKTRWVSGKAHPTREGFISSTTIGKWQTMPGYSIDGSKNGAAYWKPYLYHPTTQHLLSSVVKGKWIAEPGYVFKKTGDQWTVVWTPGLPFFLEKREDRPVPLADTIPDHWVAPSGYEFVDPARGLEIKPVANTNTVR